MKLCLRAERPRARYSLVVALVAGFGFAAIAMSPRPARADDAGDPCGGFDFSQGIDCTIEVRGGCTADCTPLQFEVGCSGGCQDEVPPTAACTTVCDSSCSNTCDPNALDCMAGCHGECDQSMIEICQQQTPQADCVTEARAQCDMHCQSSCSGAPSSCPGQCRACCVGSCTGQVNYQCDYQCFANLQGGCSVQCQQPAGALFCNGQYVHASDVDACIAHLAAQGVNVDVSARGAIACSGAGCQTTGEAGAGACSVSEAVGGGAGGGLALTGVALAFGVGRARRRRGSASAGSSGPRVMSRT
jgi:hypothetical protein